MSEEKFQGKYRIPSARADWHNYDGGVYFVTICTKDMLHYFGEIVDAKMNLTDVGKYADEQMKNVTTHYQYAEIPLWVVMPDHIHGIVIIDDIVGTQNFVETQNFASLHDNDPNKFGPQSKNLASVIRGFKIGVTKFARQNNISFSWQSRYYDRIIRDTAEMNRIAEYIENNVAEWDANKDIDYQIK